VPHRVAWLDAFSIVIWFSSVWLGGGWKAGRKEGVDEDVRCFFLPPVLLLL